MRNRTQFLPLLLALVASALALMAGRRTMRPPPVARSRVPARTRMCENEPNSLARLRADHPP